MLTPFTFASTSARDDSQIGKDTARLLNMYAEGGENGLTLRSAPGLTTVTSVGPGEVKAMVSTPDGIRMAVGGSWKLWDGTSVTTHGSLAIGDTTIARSRSQIAVTAGRRYYVWDGSTFTERTSDLTFANPQSVAFLSNYFIISQDLGQAYQYTLDADTIDPLDFASAEYQPDDLRRVMASNDLIWLMGERTIEPWQVTGAALLPFSRISGQVIEKGLRATMEAVKLDNTIFWISPEPRMYRMGGGAEVISTDAMTAALEGAPDRLLAFQERRHDFAVARRPDRPACVYDAATQTWWERSTGPTHQPWEVTATVFHDGVWYAGTQSGHLCTFSGYQDRGEELRREAISSNITQGGNRFSVNRVNLRVSGSGSVMVSWSTDGGRTFSNERQRTFGGGYEYPIEINRLGVCRQFCLKIACSDNTDFAIHGAGLEIS